MRFVCLALSATVLFACVSRARASTPTLSVMFRFEHPASSASEAAMRAEVRQLLGKSVSLHFRDGERWVFGKAVLFTMRGYCTMDAPRVSAEPGSEPLGLTYFRGGVPMPFGELDCDRIRLSMARVLGDSSAERYQRELGVAMGRVLAHELAHILRGSAQHTHDGLTREALSAQDLLANSAFVPTAALADMDPAEPIQRER